MCCVFSAGKGEGWAGRREMDIAAAVSPLQKGDVTSALVFIPSSPYNTIFSTSPSRPSRPKCLSVRLCTLLFCQGFWLSPARCIETLPSFLSAFFWAREREGGQFTFFCFSDPISFLRVGGGSAVALFYPPPPPLISWKKREAFFAGK